jgi:pimeloyl-ACP methyl ester carboxylesterase
MNTHFHRTNAILNSTIVHLLNRIATPPSWKSLKAALQLAVTRGQMGLVSRLAPRYALHRAQSMFVTPPRFDHSALERKLIASATSMPIDTRYGRIAAWRMGDLSAPAVVLCHGWGGRGAQLRAFVAPLVSSGYQVVFFDHLGHGMSDGRQAALVDFWRGVEAVWDGHIFRGIIVHGMVAHSLGGAAVASALRRSLTRKHVNAPSPRVVLIAPPASLIRYSKMFARYIGITERVRRAMQWRFEQRYGVSWEEFELPQSVATIAAPALFIHDRDDRETKFEGGLALARTWPDARFFPTAALGHRRILRDRTVINHTIDFLADRVEFRRAVEAIDAPAPLY